MSHIEREKERQEIELRERFCRLIARKYENWCKREGLEPTTEGLVQYTLKHKLIDGFHVHRYMTVELYPEALYHSNGKKRPAVRYLEEIIPVSDRRIWEWIAKARTKYSRPGKPPRAI